MRKLLCFLIICGQFLFCHSVYANSCGAAGMKHCSNHHYYDYPNLNPNGCNQLQVMLTNNTAYYLKLNKTATTSSVGELSAIYDKDSNSLDLSTFSIAPNASYTLILNGQESEADSSLKDEVDMTFQLPAYLTNPIGSSQATGAQLTVHFTKASCNASRTTCQKKDSPCYCHGAAGGACIDTVPECTKTYYHSAYEDPARSDEGHYSNPVYEPLRSQNHYWSVNGATDCDEVKTLVNPTASFSDAYAIYGTIRSLSKPSFSCSSAAVCSASTSDNTPATASISINPAQIETLKITLPFSTQTPTAKILKDSIYGNLDAEYVSRLGSYFSYQPVVVEDKTIAFSTLCNSADCP